MYIAAGIREVDGRWLADSPMGPVEVRFTGPVDAGVLDHEVLLPDGSVVHNPLRVMPNDDGSEVVFSLFHRAGMADEDFAADVAAVTADLDRLAGLLERDPG